MVKCKMFKRRSTPNNGTFPNDPNNTLRTYEHEIFTQGVISDTSPFEIQATETSPTAGAQRSSLYLALTRQGLVGATACGAPLACPSPFILATITDSLEQLLKDVHCMVKYYKETSLENSLPILIALTSGIFRSS
ncbi:hypothetical protein AZE42_03884 [Rhizopogon vesiculosus]|uniref:Uncharacterized protein n=1 Tax=Rhizopogon vesiculosus TaxID=180088 RepID=A0A1J8RHM5_9AGAM|nr:hypothetical protein AZE42_03884 [Rhizopogon vesiculosus]